MDNQQLGFPSRQCSSTPVGFGQRLPSKEQCNNITSSPTHSWPASSWFLHVPWSEISTEGTALLGYYWRHWECDGGAEEDFTKWLPWIFPSPVQSMAEVYSCIMGLLLRKIWFKWLYWFVFLTNRVTPATFWSCYIVGLHRERRSIPLQLCTVLCLVTQANYFHFCSVQ